MATALDPSQSTLSPNFADYIYNYLGRAQAAANLPFQPFTGQRFAGASPLQEQAFTGFGQLQVPGQFQTATNMLTQAGGQAQAMGYTPTQFGSTFQGPGAYQTGAFANQFQAPGSYQPQGFTSGYQAPSPYQTGIFASGFGFQPQTAPTQFSNLYQAPSAYRPSTDFTQGIGGQRYDSTQFQTGLGPVKSVQDYMSQYTGGVSDIAAREATRQADISRQAEQARLAQAGAYGGSRQAIMEAERQRNLGTQIGDIRTKGLQEAYDRAQQQRLQEAGLGMEAQKATEASRQFGATFGQSGLGQLLQARQMGEQAKQFGAQQEAQARDLQAKYGLSAQQAQEAARQFGEGQRLTAADLSARYGLDAQKAAEMSRQFGAQQAMTGAETAARLGLDAQRAAAQERQFGAQQELQARDLQAKYGLSAEQAREASRQFGYGQQMTAADLAARYGLDAQKASEMSRQFGAQYAMDALGRQQAIAQALAGVGTSQFGSQLQGLEGLLRAGGTQREIAQQPLDFGYQQFQESLKYPMQQAQYLQSMIQGLPVQARPYDSGVSGAQGMFGGALAGLQLYNLLTGKTQP